MRRVDSLEKTLMLGGIWGQEEKGTTEDEMAGWHHWLDAWVWMNSGSWWWTGRPGVLQFMGSQRVGHDWATEVNRTDPPKTHRSVKKRLLLCQIASHHKFQDFLQKREEQPAYLSLCICNSKCGLRTVSIHNPWGLLYRLLLVPAGLEPSFSQGS